jgi:probable phosphoglycerate mutase
MSVIIFVRHGIAQNSVTGVLSSRLGDGLALTPIGIEEAKRAADELVKLKITRLYSSPQLRALQTAEIFSKRLGISITNDARLVDRHFGDMDGTPYDNGRWRFRFTNAEMAKRHVEPWEDIQKRMGDFVASIEPTGITVVSTHDSSIKAIVSSITGLNEMQIGGMAIRHCGFSVISGQGKDYNLIGTSLPVLANEVLEEINSNIG